MFPAQDCGGAPNARSLPFLVVHAILHCHRKHKLGAARTIPGHVLKTSLAEHVCLQCGRSRRRTASTPSFCDVHNLQIRIPQFSTSLHVENAVDTLIDFPNTQTFIEHQMKDSREHALLPPQLPQLCQLSTHLSLSTPLITTPHPLFPLSLMLPPQ